MENQGWERLKELFAAAVELPPAERDDFVNRSCGVDEELKSELLRLLSAHVDAGGFLSSPAVDASEPPSAGLPVRLSPTTVLAGRFRIIRSVARGGMGEVYEAEDLELGEHVALKTIRPDFAADERVLDLFRHEIQLARRVTHPNVCRIFEFGRHTETDDAGEESEIRFLAMELLEGVTLAQRLKSQGPFPPSEALVLIEQMAAALEAAHEAGVIHRDFKPGNVMLVPRGPDGKWRAVVTDFGLALATRAAGEGDGPGSSPRGGTPGYMAPEQAEGGPVTTAADVYSLGMVAAELVGGCGRDGKSTRWWSMLQAVGVTVPAVLRVPVSCAGWKPVLQRCVEADPGRRYQHPGEVAAALRTALSRRNRTAFWRLAIPAAALVVVLLALQPFVAERYRVDTLVQQTYRRLHPNPALGFKKRDWVLVTSFENRTGEKLLDGTLEYTLERELSNSQFVSVASRARVEDALRLMQKPIDSTIDRTTGREICLRDGGIRAMLAGRAEKVSGRYRLTLDVVNPQDGSVVETGLQEATNEASLTAAVRRLSSWTRERLGQEVSTIREDERQLEKVSTPSLQAARLYSLADQAMKANRRKEAEGLLREALATDPEFASAEILLAWVIKSSGGALAEYRPHAEHAYRLSEGVSEREKLFIRGSYHHLRGEADEARRQYQELVRLYPDHYWGNNNLAYVATTLGEFAEAYSTFERQAEAQPLNPLLTINAGDLALRVLGDLSAARAWAEHFRRTFASEMTTANVWADLFPIHENWQAGRIDLAHREATRLAETLDTLKGDMRHACATIIGSIFLALGEVRQAAEAYRYISNNPGGRSRRPWEPAILAFASEDREGLRESVKWFCLDAPHPFVRDEFTALLLLRAGFNEQAKEALTRLRDPDRGAREWRTVRGAIALERGDRPEAIRLLREALAYPGIWGTPPYFLGSEYLAIALEREGRLTDAITVLENASRDKPRTFHRLYGSTGLYWLRIQEQLVRLCRKAGRTVEAAAAEEDLLHTLSHADPDHPILRRIRKGG